MSENGNGNKNGLLAALCVIMALVVLGMGGFLFWYLHQSGKSPQKSQNVQEQAESGEKESVSRTVDAAPDDQPLSREKIKQMKKSGTIEVLQDGNANVDTIDGNFSSIVVNSEQDALQVLEQTSAVLGDTRGNLSKTAKNIDVSKCEEGTAQETTHYLFTQEVNGVRVRGSDVILMTDQDGLPIGLFSSYNDGINDVSTDVDPSVDDDVEIEDIVRDSVRNMCTEGAERNGEEINEEVLDAFLSSLNMEKTLVIYAMEKGEKPCLAWEVLVSNSQTAGDGVYDEEEELPSADEIFPSVSMKYYIYANGAKAGEILQSYSEREGGWSSATSTGKDLKGKKQTFQVQENNGKYRMVDEGRNISIYQTLYQSDGFLGLGMQRAVLPGNMITKGMLGWNKKAVSAQVNFSKIYDYYKNILGRESYGGRGEPIVVSIEYVPDNSFGEWLLHAFFNNNEFWSPGIQQFVFHNAGNNEAALDICAHEYTHAVINTIVGGRELTTTLTYVGESGALNEAYADIMGSLIEGKDGEARWLIVEDGDEIYRNMADPSQYSQPEHYDDRYIPQVINDDENSKEVHTNSGIVNFAAYKMMTDSRTTGISKETWARVYYNSLYNLNTNAGFMQARFSIISAARNLGFTDQQLTAIKEAFDEVGIYGDSEEDENETEDGENETEGKGKKNSADGTRDIVLVLDRSGSMDGEPLEQTKEAAKKFVQTVFEKEVRVALVTYDTWADVECELTDDQEELISCIDGVYSGNMTNMYDGLSTANEILQSSNADKKIIVLMSDGLPNEGNYDNQGSEMEDYAAPLRRYGEELKNKGYDIYTLGFFETLKAEGSEWLPEAQALMENIASEGYHYEVASAEDLVFFFDDIANQIAGLKYVYIRIACPVDVTVTGADGTVLTSKEGEENTRASFGTLTYEAVQQDSDTEEEEDYGGAWGGGFDYDNEEDSGSGEREDQVKILRLNMEEVYDVKIEGYGNGTMNYTVKFPNENGEYDDIREFPNIKVTSAMKATSNTEEGDATRLEVDEDGDGKTDVTYETKANGSMEEVKDNTLLYILLIGGGVILLLLFIMILVLVRNSGKKKEWESVADGQQSQAVGYVYGAFGIFAGQSYPLMLGQRCVVGRKSTCDIQLVHSEVSRVHCVIQMMPDGVYQVTDYSSNGTFYNNQRLCHREPYRLPKGALLAIGDADNVLELR